MDSLTIYHNTSDKEVVDKVLDTGQTFNVVLKDGHSILSPVFEIQMTDYSFNYCYFPKFNRYYYITDIIKLTGGRCELHCKCDVLMSWKVGIRNCKAILKRQQTNGNLYLNDDKFYLLNKQELTTVKFPNSFSKTGSLVLIVNGGNGSGYES